ncbi:unnamed protein product [Cunninghamella blakesleeana]
MILKSNATRNEEWFNAILPSWNKYCDTITDRNTISKWHITDMVSVRLKLCEFMNIWDKAILIQEYASTNSYENTVIFPIFSGYCDTNNPTISKEFVQMALKYIRDDENEEKGIQIERLVDKYHIN